MEIDNSGGGGGYASKEDLDEVDSSCSTPYYSAPSSPGRSSTASIATLPGYYYSAPASPMHFVLSSFTNKSSCETSDDFSGSDFEFSARFANHTGVPPVGSMSSADELFLNGQIRPMKLSTHLQSPQVLAPLMDLGEDEDEDEDEGEERKDECLGQLVRGRELRIRSRSMHRRSRSLSPLRSSAFQWQDGVDQEQRKGGQNREDPVEVEIDDHVKVRDVEFQATTTATESSASASSSRSNSSGRNGKRWIFLKDFLLYRSKSEGRGNGKEKFWQSISFSPSKDRLLSSSATSTVTSTSLSLSFFSKMKEKSKDPSSSSTSTTAQLTDPPKKRTTPNEAPKKPVTSSVGSKPKNAVGKRRIPAPSAHERHYTTNRAQAVEMRKRTYLPYRQGLLGCLGFSSKGYGAMNGFARSLNPVSSR